jgi:hypothetical protein
VLLSSKSSQRAPVILLKRYNNNSVRHQVKIEEISRRPPGRPINITIER